MISTSAKKLTSTWQSKWGCCNVFVEVQAVSVPAPCVVATT